MAYDLIVPPQFARLDVERDDGRGVQVVALPNFAAVHRNRVARLEVGQAEVRVDDADEPDAGTAGRPAVVVLRPRVVARLTRTGYREERPQLLAGLGVDADHTTAKRPVAVGEADQNDPGGIGRRGRDALALLARRVAKRRRPHHLAGPLPERDQLSIAQTDEHQALAERRAGNIRQRFAGNRFHRRPRRPTFRRARFRFRELPRPDRLAGLGVEGEDRLACWQDQHAVLHHRRRARRAAAEPLVPGTGQRLHVRRIDLLERRVARARPVAANERPVLAGKGAAILLVLLHGHLGGGGQKKDYAEQHSAIASHLRDSVDPFEHDHKSTGASPLGLPTRSLSAARRRAPR